MGLRGIAMAGAVLIGATLSTLSAHAQENTSEDATAQPAAMTPENQIEADEGDHHEGYYYPKPGSFEHYPARVYTLRGLRLSTAGPLALYRTGSGTMSIEEIQATLRAVKGFVERFPRFVRKDRAL